MCIIVTMCVCVCVWEGWELLGPDIITEWRGAFPMARAPPGAVELTTQQSILQQASCNRGTALFGPVRPRSVQNHDIRDTRDIAKTELEE